MRVHYPKLRNIVHPISLLMFLLLPKDQTFVFYLRAVNILMREISATYDSSFLVLCRNQEIGCLAHEQVGRHDHIWQNTYHLTGMDFAQINFMQELNAV